MPILHSQIRTGSQAFLDNRRYHLQLEEDLQKILSNNQQWRTKQAQHKAATSGKWSVRQRLQSLLDPASSFLELSALAAQDCYDFPLPGAGIVAGIGAVSGRLCMIVANDPLCKAGCYFPESIKKHLRAQEIALENRLPCIYLVDSGGIYLPLQSKVFADTQHFGKIFANQARLSQQGIPQVAVVLGMCTAGGAYVPAMSDENIIVRQQGTIYLASPPLVKAATGEIVSDQELGGADMHARRSGVVDHLVEDEAAAMIRCREVVSFFPQRLLSKSQIVDDIVESVEPLYDCNELYGIVPKDLKQSYNVNEVLARLLDGSFFTPFKEQYGTTLVCGFGRLWGMAVGIVANQGVIFSESAQKGAHFVQLCHQRQIPLLFLQNITGFMVGRQYEEQGIIKDGAKMVQAVATANVPKITLMMGASHGAGNYAMCGRGFSPRFLYSWPHSKISVMGQEQALFVLQQLQNNKNDKDLLSPTKQHPQAVDLQQRYEKESHAYYATSQLWDDGIIVLRDTRRLLALSLTACWPIGDLGKQSPVYRM